jgi:3-hydroxybutyryl-CoA dehydratase
VGLSYKLGKCVDEVNVGDSASFTKTISESDVLLYAAITEDHNPIHTDEAYAARTHFKKRLVHGPLIAGLVAPVLGMKLPGMGTIAVSQTLRYLAPVYIGDRITVTIVACKVIPKENLVHFDCTWVNQNGIKIMDGKFTVKPPPRKFKEESR